MPNCFVPIIGGLFVDKFGIRIALCTFMVISLIGNLIFGIGALSSSFLIMLIGRGVFGLVNNSVLICTIMIVTLWFVDHNLNFALGLLVVYPCTFDLLCSYLAPLLVEYDSLQPDTGMSCLFAFIL